MNYMRNLLMILVASLALLMNACIDDSAVAVNSYDLKGIVAPVDRNRDGTGSFNADRKVHIGHDLPVDIELTAEYNEEDIPVQVYLLNIDDIEEVEAGIGDVGDIRMYYIARSSATTIEQLQAGTHTYNLSINIPADDGRDEMTGDWKTGTFCIVGEVNKNDDAEIDAYAVYEKFKDKLADATYRADNTILVTTEYMSKPDLMIEKMHFTAGSDEALNVVTFLDLDLGNLPGAEDFKIDIPGVEIENPLTSPFHIIPSASDRTFMGNVHVRSSACEALNVPVTFKLESTDLGISIPLNIYDIDMGGWTKTYYIPMLKANTTERVSLALRIPDDGDFSVDESTDGDGMDEDDAMMIREIIGDGDVYKSYNFKIVAEVNPGGTINESRFLTDKDGNYYPGGDADPTANNSATEDVLINIEKMEVESNEGIKVYPYDKVDISEKEEADKQLVIFWDGFEFKVGDEDFGARAQIHEGCLFRNFSLYSFGVGAFGNVFGNQYSLVDTYLNAICTPKDPNKSAFDMHVEAMQKVYFSEASLGHTNNDYSWPITLYSKEWSKEYWYYCFRFKIVAGIDVILTPGVRIDLYNDGSLNIDKYCTLVGALHADASASIAGLATIGLYTWCDVVTIEVIQSTGTRTEFGTITNVDTGVEHDAVKGTVYRDFGIYLTGPKGYVDFYIEIDFLLFSKRWSWTIFRYSTFRIPIVEFAIYSNIWGSDALPADQGNEKYTTLMRYDEAAQQ